MPEMDGYTATARIKKNRPEIPVIAVTAYAQDTDREKFLPRVSQVISQNLSTEINCKNIDKISGSIKIAPGIIVSKTFRFLKEFY